MKAEPKSTGVNRLLGLAMDLAWSLWAELGVSSWRRQHQEWTIELEPLVALTAILARHDPRLLRESLDWCVRNHRFISLHQFRHVITNERWPFEGAVADYGAMVQVHTRQRWPGVARNQPSPVSLSGKSQRPDLRRPSLVQLRLRALFGVGARAEIVRVLLHRPSSQSVRQITDRIAYTRRQVAFDLDMLVASGAVRRSERSGPSAYTLSDASALTRLVGDVPRFAPRWAALFRVLTGLLDGFEAAHTLHAPDTELVRQLRLLGGSVEDSGLSLPQPDPQRDYQADLLAWSLDTFSAIAAGDARPLDPDSVMVPPPSGVIRS